MYAFGVDAERGAAMTGQLMTVVGIFTLASALPAGWLSDQFGRKRLLGLSGLLGAAGTAVVMGTVWLPNLEMIFLGGSVLGLGTGLFVTVNWSLGTQLVPPEEAGRYLGVSNLAGAGAGIIGSGIGGLLADLLNASLPGLGYFVIFTGYLLLFLLSSLSLRGISREAVVPAYA
jgi:MFS family permease